MHDQRQRNGQRADIIEDLPAILRRQEYANETRKHAAERPAQRHAPQREAVAEALRRKFVDVGRAERQKDTEAKSGEESQNAEAQEIGGEQWPSAASRR